MWQALARSWAAAQKRHLDALTALSWDTAAMLLAAADAEDAPSRHAMLADAAAAAQGVAAPLTAARAAWHKYFGDQGEARAAEIVAADGLAALRTNAAVNL